MSNHTSSPRAPNAPPRRPVAASLASAASGQRSFVSSALSGINLEVSTAASETTTTAAAPAATSSAPNSLPTILGPGSTTDPVPAADTDQDSPVITFRGTSVPVDQAEFGQYFNHSRGSPPAPPAHAHHHLAPPQTTTLTTPGPGLASTSSLGLFPLGPSLPPAQPLVPPSTFARAPASPDQSSGSSSSSSSSSSPSSSSSSTSSSSSSPSPPPAPSRPALDPETAAKRRARAKECRTRAQVSREQVKRELSAESSTSDASESERGHEQGAGGQQDAAAASARVDLGEAQPPRKRILRDRGSAGGAETASDEQVRAQASAAGSSRAGSGGKSAE